MGSACCVAARDKTLQPSRTSTRGPRNVGYSPTWSCSWDNQGRVADEVDNPSCSHSYVTSVNIDSENKDSIDVECDDLSERQSQVDFQTPIVQKSPSHEEPGVNSMFSYSGVVGPEASLSSSLNEAKELIESSEVADPSAPRLSFSVPQTPSSSSMFKGGELSTQRRSLHGDSTSSSWKTRHSPGYHMKRVSDLKSPSNSISEGRPSFVFSTCSNDISVGSQGGRSSDGWSMSTFSELVAASQKERWSFDSDNLDSARGNGKVTRSNSNCLAPRPSNDVRTCGVCAKLLMEKSPWVAQKFISNELSVVAVLVCGHVYHAECLENTTPEAHRFDPPCPVCTTGALKTIKIDAESKGRNRISRNRVVDFDYTGPSQWSSSSRRDGKSPMLLGSSSSMKNSFAKPFLKRHFSLGSKSSSKSILENEFTIKSPSRKGGFWSRYRKG